MPTGPVSPPDDPPPELTGDWHLDAEPPSEAAPGPPPPATGPLSAATPSIFGPRVSAAAPPAPEQIIEAMLFVGGPPLTAEAACAAVRGLTPERFRAAIDALNHRYRRQRRPYAVFPRDDGFQLALLPAYRGLRERLYGGPREVRLSQPALDVLSLIAYRQPIGKSEIDALRGADSGAALRQLLRLGLIAVRQRAESDSREVRYGTTHRFLTVFGLTSLDELPRLGETRLA